MRKEERTLTIASGRRMRIVAAGCAVLIGACCGCGDGSETAATVTCVSTVVHQGVDALEARGDCTVEGAAARDVTFALDATLKAGATGTDTILFCEGALIDGAGTCSGTYTVNLNFTSELPNQGLTVAGAAHPSGRRIRLFPLFESCTSSCGCALDGQCSVGFCFCTP
jgi:hypothetical protein